MQPILPIKTLQEKLAMFKSFMKHGHIFPQMTSNTETPLKYVTSQGESNALALPIPYLTRLASSFEIHGTKVVNVLNISLLLRQKKCINHISSLAKR
jgi:hypothetical protein